MSEGCEKLCHIGRLASLYKMKLPDSNRDANSTPMPEVLEVQIVVSPSMRTRFPVVSSSTIALLVTAEFLEN